MAFLNLKSVNLMPVNIIFFYNFKVPFNINNKKEIMFFFNSFVFKERKFRTLVLMLAFPLFDEVILPTNKQTECRADLR